ncbi:MAG: SH3 domain-containing protein [Spirochaetales bacterium]
MRIIPVRNRIFLVCLITLLGVSCNKKPQPIVVVLPPTPILTVQANWALVVSPYLRVRKHPSVEGEVVAHLRNSSITEIVSRTAYPETLEGKTDYWYEISAEGKRGWVFGSYLKFFNSRAEAEMAAQLSKDS